jgi:hypothetical protein
VGPCNYWEWAYAEMRGAYGRLRERKEDGFDEDDRYRVQPLRGRSGAAPRRSAHTHTAKPLKVSFWKSGRRRYGVLVSREHHPDLVMNPAPGYDDYLPLDLLHFVAEAEWELGEGKFGQLAAGGNASTFRPTEQPQLPGAMRDRRRRRRRAGQPKGRRSDLLASILEEAWHTRHGRSPLPNWQEQLEAADVSTERLERVVDQLDQLAQSWHSLPSGEHLSLDWPHPEKARAGGLPRG